MAEYIHQLIQHSPQPGAREAASRRRVDALFTERYRAMAVRYDRMFMWLLLAQWAASIVFALFFSPLAWAGRDSVLHSHVVAAVVVGFAITSLPVFMVIVYPGAQSTRYVTASAQVLWSALFIHLSGGRIETHFHVFASLGILAFYRDPKVFIPATILVAGDHFARGLYWPESVYGIANPEWWRFLEHAFWVVFADVFLVYNCVRSYRELREYCEQQVALEDATEAAAREATARIEKLAAIGQLAASVGHELRNPLAAIRNAHAFIGRRLAKEGELEPKVAQFMGLITRELDASTKIIGSLLDFARPQEAIRNPCPLRPLVSEAIGLVPPREGVTVINAIPEDLPIPDLDRDQFRQIFVNLIQNACEAVPAASNGRVTVSAQLSGQGALRVAVRDNGCGLSPDELSKIFQPLFSTKVKGTGLGLAIVASIVERHGGTIRVESTRGEGTVIEIDIPIVAASKAA